MRTLTCLPPLWPGRHAASCYPQSVPPTLLGIHARDGSLVWSALHHRDAPTPHGPSTSSPAKLAAGGEVQRVAKQTHRSGQDWEKGFGRVGEEWT